MRSIGIDFSKNGLSVVEVYADRSHYEIIKGYYHPHSPQSDSDWELEALQVLKQLAQEFDFRNNFISVSLPQDYTSVRNLNFPFSRRLDILKSLPFELDEELPMGMDNAAFDAKITALMGNATSVLAYATPTDYIENTIEFFKKLHIDPDVICPESAAFSNLYENWAEGSFLNEPPEDSKSPLTMRIYFRRETSLATLFSGGQLVWSRNFSWGEKDIIGQLMKTFSLPHSQAADMIPEKTPLLLNTQGASKEDLQMAQAISVGMKNFVQNLKHSMLDIEEKFAAPVEQVVLLGPVAFIPNLPAHMTKAMGIPFSTESIGNDVFQSHQISPIAHFAEQAPVAVGLALEALKRPKNPAVNFRRGLFAKKNQFFEKLWEKWGYTAVLCAVAYVCYTVYGFSREQITRTLDDNSYVELSKHAENIAGLKGAKATPNRIANFIEQEETKMKNKKIFEQVQDIEPAMKVVNRLSNLLPPNQRNQYDVRRVDVNTSKLEIEGVAKNKNTIRLIQDKLKALAKDKKVQPIQPKIRKEKGNMFAFKILLKG